MSVFAAIDTGALFKVVWVSILAGAGVTLAYSGALYGSSRASECRREGWAGAGVFTGMAVACSLIVLAALVAGFLVMTSK